MTGFATVLADVTIFAFGIRVFAGSKVEFVTDFGFTLE
jgi:hypothetical protein